MDHGEWRSLDHFEPKGGGMEHMYERRVERGSRGGEERRGKVLHQYCLADADC